mmetsp:Transcript_78406/g.199343  ORF Transcript_78406/g.199343 Transcript_78406/m.199343 type:complete len:594 (-) Transcript_78406:110-1891(-)
MANAFLAAAAPSALSVQLVAPAPLGITAVLQVVGVSEASVEGLERGAGFGPGLVGLGAGLSLGLGSRRRRCAAANTVARGTAASRPGRSPAVATQAAVATAAATTVGVSADESARLRAAAAQAVRQALGEQVPKSLQARRGEGKLRPLIVAMGTRGDVEPGLRLAATLRDRGHDPMVLSLDAYESEIVQRWKLPFRSCGLTKVPMAQEYLEGKTRADQVYADRGWYGDAWVSVGNLMYKAACEHGCDVIVATSMGNTHALDVAEKLDILCVSLKFSPDIDGQVPTGSFPPSGYPLGMPGPLNVAAHVLENVRTVGAVFSGGFIPRVIGFRKDLGFPSMTITEGVEVPVYSDYRNKLQANQPCLYAFSEALTSRPPEYQPWHFVIGALGRKDAGMASIVSEDSLPEGLRSFLATCGERKPACVAFGSISLARVAPFQERAVRAARALGLPVVVVDLETQQEGVSASDPEAFFVRSVPYAALLPRCSIVVHHGGAGTMQDCLWAGVPQVAAPVLSWSDQPFWADELQARGLGISLGRGAVSPEEAAWKEALAAALRSEAGIRVAAAEAVAGVAAERGAEAACDVLEGAVLGCSNK